MNKLIYFYKQNWWAADVVDFYDSTINKLAQKYESVLEVVKINIEDEASKELIKKYEISTIPSVVFIRFDEFFEKLEGCRPLDQYESVIAMMLDINLPLNREMVAHLCIDGKIKPYNYMLCSSCLPSSKPLSYSICDLVTMANFDNQLRQEKRKKEKKGETNEIIDFGSMQFM